MIQPNIELVKHLLRGHSQMEVWLVALHYPTKGKLAHEQDLVALLHDLRRGICVISWSALQGMCCPFRGIGS